MALKCATRNMRSAAEEVEAYLAKECEAGRVIGPLPGDNSSCKTVVHVSRFGVIQKPGKWCLIVDLSHPPGRSVNDGVRGELCSLAYASIDDTATVILRLGR